MSHGPTNIPTKGCCIYCGATGVRLTREHIVPLSLGGTHVIEKASCDACADITKRFEQDVARELWGHARISADAPSRRKKNRPTHITVGHPTAVRVPYSEYPPSFVFYTMPLPGVLEGAAPDADQSAKWLLEVICDGDQLKSFNERHKTQVSMSFRHVPQSFGRMMAKIGYGHILTQLDVGDFDPIVLPYILGTDSNVSHVVGCKPVRDPPNHGLGYKLQTIVEGLAEQAFIIAEVRLLANCHTPSYLVVVGKTRSIENTQAVLAKLGAGVFIT